MAAYYNEFDPFAAVWLRELVTDGVIAPGDVDERSITEVHPDDLRGYTQCHFFAGIGGWSYALRLAGWPDDRPVWTGSCPCQPFSAAGKQQGEADARHLWPEFRRLIAECRPGVIVGEQVSGAKVIRVADKGSRLQPQVSPETPGEDVGAACQATSRKEETPLRSRSARHRTSGADRQWFLRVDGAAIQHEWWEDLGQSISGSDRPGQGLRSLECSCGLPWCELCARQLGRGTIARHGTSHYGETAGRLELALREVGPAIARDDRPEWFAGVSADLEALGYRVGACDLAAASAGAPHIRQRLFWAADANTGGRGEGGLHLRSGEPRPTATQQCGAGGLEVPGRENGTGRSVQRPERSDPTDATREHDAAGVSSAPGGVGESLQPGLEGLTGDGNDGNQPGRVGAGTPRPAPASSDVLDAWADFTLLPCRDGKARRTQSGLFPLVDGLPRGLGPGGDPRRPIPPDEANATAEARVNRLRGYGNAIVPQVAALFLRAYLEAR